MTVRKQNTQEQIEQLQAHKTAGNRAEFNKVLFEFMPHFRKVIHHKIRQMELRGDLPKNMYSAQGIVDEVYLRLYQESSHQPFDENYLKARMFSVAKKILGEIREKENGKGKDISMEEWFRREMQELEEPYSVDAEGELVLLEDLDDISYDQEEYGENLVLIEEEKIDELARTLSLKESDEPLTDDERKRLGKAYSDLPETSREVIDYVAFGKLNEEQVASVLEINIENISDMLEKVRTRFRSVLKKK
jgi:DNA-directed RNA polymerase specialized sigma24 family protein